MKGPQRKQIAQDVFIKKIAEPANIPANLRKQQEKATVGWLRAILDLFRRFIVSDIDRLREAFVKGAEGESAKRINEAKKLDAEAQRIHAEAEVKLQEAALKELELKRQTIELENKRIEYAFSWSCIRRINS